MNSIFTFPHLDIRVAKVGVASTNYVAQKKFACTERSLIPSLLIHAILRLLFLQQ